MSMYYREHGHAYVPEYERPGRTKQSFKDDCDINKILAKAQKAGTLSHLQKHGAFYGDFANAPTDLHEARALLERGQAIFSELPSSVRKDFDNDPTKFFAFVNDPANSDRLDKVLPEIAEPGNYFEDRRPNSPPGTLREPTGAAGAQANATQGASAPVDDGGSEGSTEAPSPLASPNSTEGG